MIMHEEAMCEGNETKKSHSYKTNKQMREDTIKKKNDGAPGMLIAHYSIRFSDEYDVIHVNFSMNTIQM